MKKTRPFRVTALVPLAIGAATMVTSNLSPTTKPNAAHRVTLAGQTLACKLPFDSIREGHPIDAQCPLEGDATKDPQIGQNRAKNNFCAPKPGKPIDIAFADFTTLQATAVSRQVTFGSNSSVPADRSKLQTPMEISDGKAVAEGDAVRVVAFVQDAHPSDVKDGESVNCKIPGRESNDIHIVLVDEPDADPCESITAEISPHYRPEAWSSGALNKLATRPLRFTGQLFFDASHAPCSNGKRPNPKRKSLFEVHPVYAVEVCRLRPAGVEPAKLLESCRQADSDAWIALEDWASEETTEDDEG